ncbi:hypothetical protein [Frankia sp. AgKG'84/4]|uniref:hypothetical protein n=1 Tax=Frankia sp. AgKG'84/4 TaxID=573490 RepID=UPI0020109C32|nr:hypothetical protein [Frankia sp. AgKG'84/4]MCL9795820.1 hypothetical protein [Frankia sp. AgKG'84/4]
MIPLALSEIATVVGGTLLGDGTVTATAPTVRDGRQARRGGLFVAFAGEHVDGHDPPPRPAGLGGGEHARLPAPGQDQRQGTGGDRAPQRRARW